MSENDELYLAHIGTKRHSGRYPWGSGSDPYQHEPWALHNSIKKLAAQGIKSQVDQAKALGFKNTSELRAAIHEETIRQRAIDVKEAERLVKEYNGNVSAAGRAMNPPRSESSMRSLLDTGIAQRKAITADTAKVLKEHVKKMKYVDVGYGVAEELGVTEARLKTTLKLLENEGYSVQEVHVKQVGQKDQNTTIKVLCPPGTTAKEAFEHRFEIGVIGHPEMADNGNPLGLKPIKSISSKRVMVNYAEDGGIEKDGVIELRRGVKGLDLGNARYAQVRIGVDGDRYLKGMAVYADDLPDGIDIRFNTNKSRKDKPNVRDVLKPMKKSPITGEIDKDNPFGTAIKDGPAGQRGYLNIVREEGDWDKWSKTLSSQMLSKQSTSLARRQLGISAANSDAELDEIMSLTNPTLKRHLLLSFADGCDSAAVHLKAAALPRQSSHVILPLKSIRPNEIYAPNFENGEKVVLIRHPHGGTFEIPELIVNNRNREAQRILGGTNKTPMARDAVGIHHTVAERLSGADFDGDTVIVIPNSYKGKPLVKTSPALKGLADFDPSAEYPGYPGMKPLSKKYQQNLMGEVSNLITDMTIKGARPTELARAVRHSMVVIDAEKHNLDWRASAKAEDIASLKRLYQYNGTGKNGRPLYGASTIISKAKSKVVVNQRDKRYSIDPKTGEKIFRETGKTGISKKTGKPYLKTQDSTKMAEAKDARDLMSPLATDMERVYADYANHMKGLANKARKASLSADDKSYSKEAYATYKPEVNSLMAKVNEAKRNRPIERKAQLIANHNISIVLSAHPEMEKEDKKKVRTQALDSARRAMGKEKVIVDITPREWEAIQAGAVTPTRLKEILRFADQEQVKQLAMPKTTKLMTDAKIERAKAMSKLGFTWKEIADSLGVSATTVKKAMTE